VSMLRRRSSAHFAGSNKSCADGSTVERRLPPRSQSVPGGTSRLPSCRDRFAGTLLPWQLLARKWVCTHRSSPWRARRDSAACWDVTRSPVRLHLSGDVLRLRVAQAIASARLRDDLFDGRQLRDEELLVVLHLGELPRASDQTTTSVRRDDAMARPIFRAPLSAPSKDVTSYSRAEFNN